MPVEYVSRLVAEGAAADLDAFAADEGLWIREPWSSIFTRELTRPTATVLICDYFEDVKRPSPDVADMAAAHPAVTFTLEYCDEDGEAARREVFTAGRSNGQEPVDSDDFDWLPR